MPFISAAEESPVIGERQEDFGHVDKCLKNIFGSVGERVSRSDTAGKASPILRLLGKGCACVLCCPEERSKDQELNQRNKSSSHSRISAQPRAPEQSTSSGMGKPHQGFNGQSEDYSLND